MRDPTVDDLVGLLVRDASRLVVVRGPTFDPRDRGSHEVLADLRDRTAINALGRALAAVRTDAALMTPGDPTFAFLAGRELLASVQWVSGYLRCPDLWPHDARLDHPGQVRAWCAALQTPILL